MMAGKTGPNLSRNFGTNLAEGEGFEPSKPFRAHTLSRRAHSTALPTLRITIFFQVVIRPESLAITSRDEGQPLYLYQKSAKKATAKRGQALWACPLL